MSVRRDETVGYQPLLQRSAQTPKVLDTAPLLRVKKDMFASGSCLFPKSFLGHQIERYRANGTTPSLGSLGELEPSFLKQAEPSEFTMFSQQALAKGHLGGCSTALGTMTKQKTLQELWAMAVALPHVPPL